MPVYYAKLTTLSREETRRYAGLKPKAVFPETLLNQACTEGLIMARPQAIWKIYPYNPLTGVILSQPPRPLTGQKIIHHLRAAREIAVLALTIGPELEQKVTEYFAGGSYTLGLLLDAAGTTAVEAAADQTGLIIQQAVASQGLLPLPRYSPGYGDWPLTSQPDILDLADGQQINLTVTSSFILRPRKSITAIIGLIPGHLTAEYQNIYENPTCADCHQLQCLARKER